MRFATSQLILLFSTLIFPPCLAQSYYLSGKGPFNPDIPSPETFLGYPIGHQHTRHDRIVDYFEKLAELSDRAKLDVYGQTYEYRSLIMLTVTNPDHLENLDQIRSQHLQLCDPEAAPVDMESLPVFVNLGYNVHGNEPSSAEAAMLTAYVLTASQNPMIADYLEKAVFFIDPVINPDGRDRHTHWANMYKGFPPVSDPEDVEHNEAWPRGRTNHYWFDLNRDWWLAIHPESRGKLGWYHQWYPNVVTDFHEMGTNSTHFFEPMKTNGSKDPVMPEENYTTLNDTFALYFSEAMDEIGSLYFTKEVFDGTYPGYGSSYPDLQGGLGILFEQASSRGHVQDRPMGELTFAFTIRNQFTSTFATIKASVTHRVLLHQYQKEFFKTAISNAEASPVRAYVFGDAKDPNRTVAFLDKLLLHKVEVYRLQEDILADGQLFRAGEAFVVPTRQPQYRIVQNAFETYDEYTDSVFYDASAWSLANFYHMPYAASKREHDLGGKINSVTGLFSVPQVQESTYAYLIPWEYYNAPAVLHALQDRKVQVRSAFKPFTTQVGQDTMRFDYGTLLIPVKAQEVAADSLYASLKSLSKQLQVPVYSVSTGYHLQGVDLGSRYFRPLEAPKVLLLIGDGVSSYEAGEVWHLMDQRLHMPITKVHVDRFGGLDLHDYNTLVMVSGSYQTLDSSDQQKIKSWMASGHTLIASRQAVPWLIKQKIVQEALWEDKDTTASQRSAYVNAPEELGKESVGGAIFTVSLDLTHPLAFGYTREEVPVYRNSTVWLKPSKNPYANVAIYTDDPHVDGFITRKNLDILKQTASLVVSRVASGRAILMVDNPNFRGSWYGTNRMFLNAVFLGAHIQVPSVR